MNYDDEFELPDGEFIPGIYNYCDRWCEKCIYTNKCMNYSMESKIQNEVDAEKRREKDREENIQYWAAIDKTMENIADLIDEETPLKPDIDDIIDVTYFEEDDLKEFRKDEEKKINKVESHPIYKKLDEYSYLIDNYFNKIDDKLIIQPSLKDYGWRANFAGLDELQIQELSSATEVVYWYQYQLCIKSSRALMGLFFDKIDFNEDPKTADYTGYAFVVILGINRSVAAWIIIRKLLDLETEDINKLIRLLLAVKSMIIKLFPYAENFHWPPHE